jgi:hypothetical protein
MTPPRAHVLASKSRGVARQAVRATLAVPLARVDSSPASLRASRFECRYWALWVRIDKTQIEHKEPGLPSENGV